jgi:hypothetical protein
VAMREGIPRKEAKEVTHGFSYHIHLLYCFISIIKQWSSISTNFCVLTGKYVMTMVVTIINHCELRLSSTLSLVLTPSSFLKVVLECKEMYENSLVDGNPPKSGFVFGKLKCLTARKGGWSKLGQ